MNLKKLSATALLSLSILLVSNVGNAANNENLLSDMGPTGFAAKIPHKIVKKFHKKASKPMPCPTGAACPCQPSPAPCQPSCQPCNPCPAPCQPCPTGAACPVPCEPCQAPCQPCPAPCQPCNPCPAPCSPCGQ